MRWLRKRFARRRKVRVGLLAVLLVVTFLLGGGIHLLHGYQVRRNAAAFLEHADAAEKEGDLQKAADYLRRYVALNPEAIEQVARLELLRAGLAETPRQKLQATFRLAAVLRKAPQRLDVRRKLAELQLEIGRFSDALQHINLLLQASGDDPELYELLARAQAGRGDFAAAVLSLRKAIELAPRNVELYLQLVALLRDRMERTEEATEVIEALKETLPDRVRTFVESARHYLVINDLDQAEADAQRAIQLAPNDSKALTIAARVALARDNYEQAARFLEAAVRAAPSDPEVYVLAARAELQQQRPEKAIELLEEGLQKTDRAPEVVLMLAELLATHDRLKEAEQLLGNLDPQRTHPGYRALVKGVIAFQRRQVLEAVDWFERASAEFFDAPDLQARALYYAALAYRDMGLLDLAASQLRRAIGRRPRAAYLRWLSASILASLGRVEDALADVDVATRYSKPDAAQAALYLRLVMLDQLRRPLKQRIWELCDRLAETLREQYADEPAFLVTYADYLWVRGRGNEALPLLETAVRAHPTSPELYVALATHYVRWQLPAKAQEVLDRAQQQVGDRVTLRIAQLMLLPSEADQGAERLEQLAQDRGQFAPQQRAQLLKALAAMWFRYKQPDRARALLQEAAQLLDYDLGVRVLLFDLALQERDVATLRRLIGEMRRIEARDRQKPQGALWRYAEAALVMVEAGETPRPEAIRRARTLLQEARAERPNWARVHAQLGYLYALEDRLEDAAKSFETAIRLGDRTPATIGRAIRVLLQANRLVDAERLLRRLHAENTLPPEVDLTASTILARSNDLELALELAREHIERQADDALGHSWYGRLLEANGKSKEAEEHYLKACQLAPQTPQVWAQLVGFYARQDQIDRAKEVIEQQVRKHLQGEALAACLSACYELIGEHEAAEKAWAELRKQQPDNPVVLAAAAEFYLRRRDPDQAEQLLRQAVRAAAANAEQHGQVLPALRRRLALVLLTRGGYARWQEAAELIEKNLAENADSRDDLRVKAMLYAVRNSAPLQRKALAMFEQLLEKGEISADERFLLAQLYYRYGQPQRGRDQMLRLLTEHPDNARYIAGYIRQLLQRRELQDAELWIERLEELQPDRHRTVELKARLLQAQGKLDEAVAVVRKLEQQYMKQQDGKPNTVGLALVGRLYETLGRAEEAGRMYREVAKQVPEGLLLLTQWLADNDHVEEALRTVEACWKQLPPERAALGVIRLARHPNIRPEHRSLFRQQLERALQADRKSVELRVAMALLYDAEGDYKTAAQTYQEVLLVDPTNVVSLNNLAWLLSEAFDRPEEALKLIDRAIAQLGPVPELLDTKAVILYRLGRIEGEGNALQLQEEAYETAPAPHIGFHLARLYVKLGRHPEARQLLAQLGPANRVKRDLHGTEIDDYVKLLATLDVELPEDTQVGTGDGSRP